MKRSLLGSSFSVLQSLQIDRIERVAAHLPAGMRAIVGSSINSRSGSAIVSAFD